MTVAEFSLRRPVTTVMLFVSLFVVGLIASFRLPLEALPDVSAPFLFVQLPYEGSTPEEVERNVLRPAEEALATMTGVKRMRGEATANGAGVFMEFNDWDRDIAITASEARERLDAIREELPDDFRRYFVFKWSTGDQAILRVRLAGDVDMSSSYDLIDRQLKRRIERVPGVARVEINGAPANEVEIAIDPDRLNAHGIALNALAERLRTVNFSVSAGMIEDGGVRLRVQPQGEVTELAELRDLVVDASGLRLGDVATVQLKPERVDFRRRLDGRAAVGLEIYKERDANLVEVSRNALAEMRAAGSEPGLEGVEFKVLQDMGESVTSSLLELAEAGAIGLLLSILVLFFFLRHWPSTLMVTLAIPICFVMTLGFMHFFGVTLNILSLMGLLLAVGMLVDNAVVVVESIYQERERNPGDTWRASIVGTRNVAIALSAGTLCHCIVFLPNLLGETNDISIFMAQIAITISVSLLASWLVAVSLIPMLSARMRTPPALAEKGGMIRRMQGRYARLLRWTLVHRGWSVAGIVLVIAASVVPIKGTTFDMFGGGDQGELNVYYQWKGSYTTAQMSEEIGRVEDFLDENRERFRIIQIYSWFGENTDSGTMLTFDDDVKDTSELAEAISKALPRSARAEIGVRGNGGQGGGGGGLGKNVSVQLVGDSAAQLRDIADDVVPMLEARPELRDVRVDQGDRGEELAVRVDRERAAAFGFSAEQVSSFVAMALRGSQLREYRRGDSEVPVWVRFEGAQQYQPSDIAGFMVRSADGRQVPLLAMVDMEVQPTDSRIARHDRQTAVGIQANLEGETTMEQARKAMESVIDSLSLPAGYGHSFSGSGFEEDQKAMQQMMFNLLLALLMIYVVMAAVFESLLFPAAIMSCVLFSILGVFWLFWLTGTSFTVMGFIGILVLMGVVVNNGIVMVEHINNLRRRGMSRTDALVEGSRERLRPILMTMGTAILAMVPISLSDTVVLGGLAYSPMARAVAGGLAFSTVVSLLFLPTIYAMLDDLANGTARLLRRARGGRGAVSAEQLAEHP
ncbi:efflux RND transporter permease subunit [Luteimonas sp. MC1572]|uniref:efflux RND transporter permease subunit n=1 Tax=Luteimonas sp. MC1572 TaxID=2799325 RepID=UPI0018F086DC|nr:efflux RND transporter permease subunit [Luteimonas sp. MC1572]MBJ6980515.1 efflux RND transporter permease subunit [Luteimonas sp. MC1572]QQO04391.1 efflux RND transporter permease subunit [Luteimonas sp. MC1572]